MVLWKRTTLSTHANYLAMKLEVFERLVVPVVGCDKVEIHDTFMVQVICKAYIIHIQSINQSISQLVSQPVAFQPALNMNSKTWTYAEHAIAAMVDVVMPAASAAAHWNDWERRKQVDISSELVLSDWRNGHQQHTTLCQLQQRERGLSQFVHPFKVI